MKNGWLLWPIICNFGWPFWIMVGHKFHIVQSIIMGRRLVDMIQSACLSCILKMKVFVSGVFINKCQLKAILEDLYSSSTCTVTYMYKIKCADTMADHIMYDWSAITQKWSENSKLPAVTVISHTERVWHSLLGVNVHMQCSLHNTDTVGTPPNCPYYTDVLSLDNNGHPACTSPKDSILYK